MANNTNNGGASMYYDRNNPGLTTDEEQYKKILLIALSVLVIVIVLVRLLICFCRRVQKDREEQDAGGGNRVRRQQQQRQSSEAGGVVWADREPTSTVSGAAMEVAPPVRAAEPSLVCSYRKADGWRGGGSCGVCLVELADGDVLRVLLACMHNFHAACVCEWLRGHDTCPLCRAPLVGPAAAA